MRRGSSSSPRPASAWRSPSMRRWRRSGRSTSHRRRGGRGWPRARGVVCRRGGGHVLVRTPTAMERLGRYQIREIIGEGAMARVYKGYDPEIDREIAIKLLKSQLADDDQYRMRF